MQFAAYVQGETATENEMSDAAPTTFSILQNLYPACPKTSMNSCGHLNLKNRWQLTCLACNLPGRPTRNRQRAGPLQSRIRGSWAVVTRQTSMEIGLLRAGTGLKFPSWDTPSLILLLPAHEPYLQAETAQRNLCPSQRKLPIAESMHATLAATPL